VGRASVPAIDHRQGRYRLVGVPQDAGCLPWAPAGGFPHTMPTGMRPQTMRFASLTTSYGNT